MGLRAEGRESQFLGVVGIGGVEAEGIVHMLKWDCAHAQLEACAYTTGSVLMLNWNVRMLK